MGIKGRFLLGTDLVSREMQCMAQSQTADEVNSADDKRDADHRPAPSVSSSQKTRHSSAQVRLRYQTGKSRAGITVFSLPV